MTQPVATTPPPVTPVASTPLEPPAPPQHEHPWWVPVWEFAAHTLSGTLIFIVIYIPAIGLNLAIHLMDGRVVEWLTSCAAGVEIFIVFIDSSLYVVFI